jgi:geranylgeranyl diphosphate synthase type II
VFDSAERGALDEPNERRATRPTSSDAHLSAYLADCRKLVLEEIRGFIPKGSRYDGVLYDIMLDYPLREAKALRPALCIAASGCLGGSVEGVLKSAATLEFYHNAFLIHDDIEDGSEKRRNQPTLQRKHGVPVALNVGDAMLALALAPMLDNTKLLGLGKALRILQCVSRMARETAEGQALELSWIRECRFSLGERDYLRMVHKKTSWYTFIAPLLIGAIVANASAVQVSVLGRFATHLGLAFQIQDDVLNLVADEASYGKEICGDLWEGKHTLILMHALASSGTRERERALSILQKVRPQADAGGALEREMRRQRERGALSDAAFRALSRHTSRRRGRQKTTSEVEYLRELIGRRGSVEYARQAAFRRASRARRLLGNVGACPSVHLRFLEDVTAFVIGRGH